MKEQILSHLPADFPWQVHWFHTIDSTNDYAKKLAAQGAPHGTVIIADAQTNGRGRLGRYFSSPAEKGIYLSVILRPACSAQKLMHLTCAAGVAMCDAIESFCGFRPGLKWINDLIADGKKLGGILTELSMNSNNSVQYAIVGVGINCMQDKEDFPSEIRDTAISLKSIINKSVARARLSAAMICALQKMDATLLTEQAAVMAVYRKDCVTLGKEIIVRQNDRHFYATALDVNPDGALVVKDSEGAIRTVNSGEVSVRGLYGYL